MSLVNRVLLHGKVLSNPIHNEKADGATVVKFILGVRRPNRGADGRPTYDHMRVEAFVAATNERSPFLALKKGDIAMFEGHIHCGTYTDDNGDMRNYQKIQLDYVNFTRRAEIREFEEVAEVEDDYEVEEYEPAE